MKKQALFAIIILITFQSVGQIKPCPDGRQKKYTCGVVEENILDRLPKTNSPIQTVFVAKLTSSFKKEKDQLRAEKIVALCNKVLNDPDFWHAIEYYDNYKYAVYQSKSGPRKIAGVEIINCLINGAPDNKTRPERMEVPFDIKLYGASFKFPFESAVAKEIGDGKIYNKRWFFRHSGMDEVGSNWMHEFSHSKDLIHCYYCHEERDYSIPYVINRIFVEVAKKYVKE